VPAPAVEELPIRSRAPAMALRPYVAGYTGYRTDPGPRGVHQGVASPHLTVILCLDGAVEMLANADPARPPGTFPALASGLHDHPAEIAVGEPQSGVQLQLTWRGARALLGLPAAELAGDTVDLAAVLGRRVGPLRERLAELPDWPTRFAMVDAVLGGLAARGRGEHGIRPEIGYAWDRLEETGGTLRIDELAREVGWSRRHLAELFRAETGVAPKAAARLIRFARATDRLRSPGRPTLAAVAADTGYVDQAHLSRDFRDLAGMTATAWLAERDLL
jgi:AraC-like DNA-binding protein